MADRVIRDHTTGQLGASDYSAFASSLDLSEGQGGRWWDVPSTLAVARLGAGLVGDE
jgi:hypothetical protein